MNRFAPCCLLLFGLSLGSAQTVEFRDVLGQLQQRYGSAETVSGQFRQSYSAPGIEQVESGVFFMKKPGLMRWEYRLPESKLFVADGRNTYLYTPADRQVMVHPVVPADLRGTPLQILLGEDELSSVFRAVTETEFTPTQEGAVMLRLVSTEAQSDYEYVVVECDAETIELRRIIIRELTGNFSEFVFSHLKTNVKLSNKQFRFKPPKGVEVIHIDERD